MFLLSYIIQRYIKGNCIAISMINEKDTKCFFKYLVGEIIKLRTGNRTTLIINKEDTHRVLGYSITNEELQLIYNQLDWDLWGE